MAGRIEVEIVEVDEAICDLAGSDDEEVAICYVGFDSASEQVAERLLCDEVLPIIRTFTNRPVTLVGFNSADDQITSAAPECGE